MGTMKHASKVPIVVLATILLTSGASAAQGSKQAQGKLSSELYRIALAAEPQESRATQSAQAPSATPPSVTVVAELVAKPDIADLSSFVVAQGGVVLGQSMGLLKFSLPATALVTVSRHTSIVHVRKPFSPSPKRKSPGGGANESAEITSQGRAVIHADAFSANTGAQGAGVRHPQHAA